MKSKIVEAKEVEPEIVYPCLMINDTKQIVVKFHKQGCGMVDFSAGDYYEVGAYRTDWGMADFTYFHGTIELSN